MTQSANGILLLRSLRARLLQLASTGTGRGTFLEHRYISSGWSLHVKCYYGRRGGPHAKCAAIAKDKASNTLKAAWSDLLRPRGGSFFPSHLRGVCVRLCCRTHVHQRNRSCGAALPSARCANTRSVAFSLVEAPSEEESERRAEWQSGGEARWAERCLPVSWH